MSLHLTSQRQRQHQQHQLLQRSQERVIHCLDQKEYGRALGHMIMIIKMNPNMKDDIKDNFMFAIGKHAKHLEHNKQWDDLFQCYNQALEVFPECECIHHDLGAHLFKLGHIDEAASYFRKALTLNPEFAPARISLENIRNVIIEQWHFVMLNDQKRNQSFQLAVQNAIQEGFKTVLDIGTGTGILSMMAVQAGADKVFACEKSKVMCQLARDVLQCNKMADRITLLHKQSTEMKIPMDIPERVSLVITETFDAGLFGEHVLLTLQHAWQHLLWPPHPSLITKGIYQMKDNRQKSNNENKRNSITMRWAKLRQAARSKTSEEETNEINSTSSISSYTKQSVEDISNCKKSANSVNEVNNNKTSQENKCGRVIPNGAIMWISLIECPWIRKNSRLQQNKLIPIDLSNIIISSEDNPEEPYTTENLEFVPEGYKFLSDPSILLDINFNNPHEIETLINGHVMRQKSVCTHNGSLDAIAVWFDLYLDQHIVLSTQPGSEVCWEQAIFPIRPHQIHGKSPYVTIGTEVESQFLCQTYLRFECVKVIRTDDNESINQGKEYMFLDSKIIQKLNDNVINSAIISAINRIISEKKCTRLIDMTQFSWPALMVCKLGAYKTAIAQVSFQDKICRLRDLSNIKKEQIMFTCVDDLSEFSECCWDVLIVDLIESNGLMNNQVLEDIALLKVSCLKGMSEIIPGKLRAYVALIQSPALLLRSKLVDDAHTLNFKIADYINIFQARIHQDINLFLLPHEKLSEPVMMWEIDFNKPLQKHELHSFLNIQRIVDVKVTTSGQISALAFWFVLDYGPDNIVDTSDPNCSWRQAAVILAEDFNVHRGDKVTLFCTCKSSIVDIQIITGSFCSLSSSSQSTVKDLSFGHLSNDK